MNAIWAAVETLTIILGCIVVSGTIGAFVGNLALQAYWKANDNAQA